MKHSLLLACVMASGLVGTAWHFAARADDKSAGAAADGPAAAAKAPAARGADAIVKDFEAVKPPTVDRARVDDPAYRTEYTNDLKKFFRRRADLARQMYDQHPDDTRTAKL